MKSGRIGFFLGASIVSGFLVNAPVFATDPYSGNINVDFTFNPYLHVDLSSGSLAIGNLISGTSSTSDPADIVVRTNSPRGYSMLATVGNGDHPSRQLERRNGKSNDGKYIYDSSYAYNFDMIDTEESITEDNINDGYWGYREVIKNGNVWSAPQNSAETFSGLPLAGDTGKEISWSDTGPIIHTVKFAIGAKADSNQPSALYENVINFEVVARVSSETTLSDITTMQEMTPEICEATPTPLASDGANIPRYWREDTRDGKLYLVSKLADGKCWMVDNLRFGGIDSRGNLITLDSTDSDLPANTTFSLTTSTPTGSAYNKSTSWVGTNTNSEYYPDESRNSSDQYYGYFYNWYAAVGGTVSGDVKADATGSICPKGWTLPPASEYDTLLRTYNINGGTAGLAIIISAPLNIYYAGNYTASRQRVEYRGSQGYYWTSNSLTTTNARGLFFNHNHQHTNASTFHKTSGFSVRCVAR